MKKKLRNYLIKSILIKIEISLIFPYFQFFPYSNNKVLQTKILSSIISSKTFKRCETSLIQADKNWFLYMNFSFKF